MKKKIIFFSICLIFIFTFGIITIGSSQNKLTVATVGTTMSNKKIGWGIKRAEGHVQPDLGSSNFKLLQEYGGIAMGNNEDKFVYLTFDNGYEAGYTAKLLDILKQNNVKAAFFITGHYLNSQPELVERMIKEEHIVGNHTVNHYSLSDLSDDELKKEIQKLHTAVYDKFGYEMKYIRPPKGEFSQRTLALTKGLGYITVMWSFAYDDWDENKQGREEYAKDKILSNIHNGCVILLHANSKDNCNVLNDMINQIKNMGYEFKTLDEFKR